MDALIMGTLFISLVVCAYFFRREFLLRKKAEEEVNLLRNSGSDHFIERGKFSELGLMSAGITHEISNPLTIILNRLSLIERTFRNPEKQKEVADGLQKIFLAAKRIEKTVQGVRRYIYRNDDAVEDEILLTDLLDDVLVFCGERLKNHGIEFRTQGLEAVFIRGHKGQFEQAILNLINNSFDAVDKLSEKWIEISAVVEKSVVDIYFKDSGPGIPMDIRKHMMEPFYTSHPARGSGLGLPLVRSIAERHGGSLVYVDKAPHTTFLLEIPRAA